MSAGLPSKPPADTSWVQMTDIREKRMGWFKTWRRRRACFHHDYSTGESWVSGRLVDMGRAKHWTCRECGRYWT